MSASSSPIRGGLIGVGNWALRGHLPVLQLLPEYRITAVQSRRRDVAEQAARPFDIPHVLDSAEAVATHEEVDLVPVLVLTTAPQHEAGIYIALALTALSTIGALLSPSHALIPVIAAIILWGAAHWGFWPAQQARLIGIAGVQAASVVLSLNASFMHLGFSLGAALGSVTLAHLSVGALGWVGGSSIFASLSLFLIIRRKEIQS